MTARSGLIAGMIAAAVASVAPAALAQGPSPKETPKEAPGQAPTERIEPDRQDPTACASRPETTGAPLSDRLARTDGVICPPSGVDPEIKAPAPEGGGAMPVIPPPGSPGGDPTVRPK